MAFRRRAPVLALLAYAAAARADRVDDLSRALLEDSSYKVRVQAALVRQALTSELAKLPSVTLSVGAGAPSAKALAERKLQGYFVDGSIARLTAAIAGGGAQIECDLKAFVATYPERSIKMMTTEGASLQTGVRDPHNAKGDC